MSENGPHILILGGLGMIGRNLIKYIFDFKLAAFVRVVDKLPWNMGFLGPTFEPYYNPAIYKEPNAIAGITDYSNHFEYMQGDLSSPQTVEIAFKEPTNRPFPFTVVINLAAETQYGLDLKYDRAIRQLRVLCAKKAAETGAVDNYVEVSTAQVYECTNSKAATEENGKINPWTAIAKSHYAAEKEIREIKGLNYVILRLPIVYGPGDVRGLMPRIVCAAVYRHCNEKMSFLWGEDLRMHTVHVQDVAAGIWHLICAGEIGEIYNLVDENDTTQGKFNKVLEKVFVGLKTGFHGSIMSNLAKIKLDELVDEANDGHMAPWEEMLAAAGLVDTPLNPYLEPELLYNNPCCIDGSKMIALGFRCSCPNVTSELVEDALQHWKDAKLFPVIE
eukprot:Tbor_TRINITY_DN2386_c0_g1::TRINITY_DN2386_c0_g1_i1::g.175::m.175